MASTSLSAPYVVPPSLASLTREKPGDHKCRPVSLPYTVLTGLESALAGIGETIMAGLVVIHRLRIQRGSSSLGASQL